LAAAADNSWRELDLRVSVNLSSHNLVQANFAADVEAHLQRTGVRPAGLCLELSELAMMSDSARALKTMRELAELGVALSIDNFGAGDASLAFLKDLPANEVKIDKSFVASMDSASGNPAFIRSIIYLAKALDLSVVAEGVETEVAAARLAELGCETAQGYYFARPLSAEAFGDWLVTHRGARVLTP
jgi:EAL domain-containing protein (putative c-di-GMP-specific phosphodiesterase class I)